LQLSSTICNYLVGVSMRVQAAETQPSNVCTSAKLGYSNISA